jgi:tRNA-modifying protein YgfZ
MSSLDTASLGYRSATDGCAVVDCSERGKLAVSGAGAREFLQGQVTNDVDALTPGAGCYAAFLTPKGKMLGDLRLLDAGDELLLDTERPALQSLFNMIRQFSVGYDVQLHKRTLERGLLSLLGPDSARVAGVPELSADEHAHVVTQVGGARVRTIRTNMGVDLLLDSEDLNTVRAAAEAAGADLIDEAVAECLRIEAGLPRYGIDLDDTVIPQEAGLNERAVSFTKGCYVGQETVARLHYRGKPNRHLRGLRLTTQGEIGDQVTFEGRVVGRLSSVAKSPKFGPIALALVRREAPPGTTVSVGSNDASAEVVELPFG